MSLRTFYHRYLTPPSTNYMFRRPGNPYNLIGKRALIFDIGSKDTRGQYAVGQPPDGCTYVCVDIEGGPGVDLVADAHDLHMVADNTVDLVISISTLEHVRYPNKVVSEIYRILKPGGIFYVSVPFIFNFHSDPHDNYRWTEDGVRIMCEHFECIESGYNRGPASAMTQLLVHFNALLFSFRNKRLYGLAVDFFTWLLFWVKYLDIYLAKHPKAKVIHAGAFFLGRKPKPAI